MTIQLAVMNGYGVAMASDRHVFRGTDVRSTGQEVKLHALRGPVPAAMMCSGPFAVFGVPVARLALRFERALAQATDSDGPEDLARRLLACLQEPIRDPAAVALPATPGVLEPVSRAPSSDLYLTLGLVCPRSGVPALAAVRLIQVEGNRLEAISRFDGPFETSWRAGRTVVVAQGSGRPLVEALVDGLGDDHWHALGPAARDEIRPGMDERWDRAHSRLGVSSPRELAAIASGLVRGAEVVGFLTREAEGTVAPVDCLCLTPQGVLTDGLDAGPAMRCAA